MHNGYKLEDKCLRNEILILVNYLIRYDEALKYFYLKRQPALDDTDASSFIDILLYYSTVDEITFYNEPIRTNQLRAFFGTNSEDLEFKKLIWSGVLIAI